MITIDKDLRKKLIWSSRLILLFFIIASLRFVYIQFIIGDEIQAEIIDKRVRETINLPERGTITDRKGNILAMSLMSQDIAVHPNLIVSTKHQERVAKLLSDNIKDLSYDEVLKTVEGTSKYKVVAKRVPPDITKIIRESGIGGIQISQSPKRLYPNDELGGTILGFVNDNNEPGAGVEIKLNNFLSGTKGYTLAEVTPFGEIIPVGTQNSITPTDGQIINLTIDSYMQHIVEDALLETARELEPSEIHAVLMEPTTGNILAMASFPSYNPNEYQKSDPSTWTNTPANFGYEPGSIIKPIFVAGALDAGVLKPDELLPSGSKVVNGALIRDWNRGKGWGMINAKDVIRYSSNVGMMAIGNKMTEKEMVEFFEKAGIGYSTNIELPGEEAGFNRPTEKSLIDDPIRKANVTFGQGIMVNPIQIAKAFSEVINGGYRIKPTLIRNITDNKGNLIYQADTPSKERVYSEYASNEVRDYLKYNMEVGSGSDFQIEGYDGGGKTGSAWYVEDGAYAKGKIIGSFVGFMPYEEPKYTLLISVKDPKGVEFGSTAAGPTFKRIMTEIVRYEGLQPTVFNEEVAGETTNETEKLAVHPTFNIENYVWKLFNSAEEDIQRVFGNDVTVLKKGNGEVITDQIYYFKGEKLVIEFVVKPLMEGKNIYIPSLVGESKMDVEKLLRKYKLPSRFYGENRIVEQNLEPGHYYKNVDLILWSK